jgi:hypothetical protein
MMTLFQIPQRLSLRDGVNRLIGDHQILEEIQAPCA